MKHLRLLSVAMLCVTTACSTAKKNAGESPSASDPSRDSAASIESAQSISFEISYSLGNRGLHQLTGTWDAAAAPHVASYLERSVIDEATIRKEKYLHFAEKVFNFAKTAQRIPSDDHECRSPFSITLKIDAKTYTSKGCRVQGEGSFGALVREGEFLLYSKK